jgi:alkylation response protein AidB-like acyl-CoA dehydrogenase
VDNGLLFSYHAHLWGFVQPFLSFASPALRDRYSPEILSGKTCGAGAVTEAGGGSHFFGIKTRAEKETGGYRLSGKKIFITNAPVADLFLIYARTGDGKRDISCFLVERNKPGLQTGETISKMGLENAHMAEVVLDGCFVPEENRLGPENAGYAIFNLSMTWERAFVLAHAVGSMERIYEQIKATLRLRQSGDRPTLELANVKERLGEIACRIEGARAALDRAMAALQTGQMSIRESAIAKVEASEAYVYICQTAMELIGAEAYTRRAGIESELRDAIASKTYSGSNSVLRTLIAGTTSYAVRNP